MPGAIKFVDTVDGPAKSESPVENGGNTSIILYPFGGAGFRNHPLYVWMRILFSHSQSTLCTHGEIRNIGVYFSQRRSSSQTSTHV